MSDSLRDGDRPAIHPIVFAFHRFRDEHRDSFNGEPSGRYLANRLEEAFRQGWLACERAVEAALRGTR